MCEIASYGQPWMLSYKNESNNFEPSNLLESAENWDFYNYFVSIHNDINKFFFLKKKLNTIRTGYFENLDRIAHFSVLSKIQVYAIESREI